MDNMQNNIYQVLLEKLKSKKPYKGFVKGKNHPEGGLSRKEAHRQGIHAGIETKDEAKRKGGFGKLSKKTQSRRKSFCARMCGMKKRRTSAKTAHDPKSKINAALRVWGCKCGTNESYEPLVEKSLKSACWKGYEAIGMKMKNGKKVPNCVPIQKENTEMSCEVCLKEKINNLLSRKESIRESFTQDIIQRISEDIVNPENAGTMTGSEIAHRDHRAKHGNFKKFKPIKGDTEEEMRHRISTWIELRKRKKNKKERTGKGKKKKK